ncbi:MAG: MmcQ/YjbR family DNA-binding protein [Prevotella sp.]|nr:MmcQ/YjbR family DNA-binding protein [Prevotella sp.]
MNIEQVREFAITLPQVTEDMPYGPDWLIFRIAGKIFLHLRLDAPQPTCAVKLEPDEGAALREHYDGIRPAYHLNKTHWSDLYLETLETSLIESLIVKSYQAVVKKLPKKLRDTISDPALNNINYE